MANSYHAASTASGYGSGPSLLLRCRPPRNRCGARVQATCAYANVAAVTGPVIDPDTRIGRYRVIRSLGRGGMAGVYEVEDPAGQRFALKAPIVDVNPSGDVTRRFAREANALRLLDHPNLVAAVDVFVEAGYLFLVMEKVEGPTLAQRMSGDASVGGKPGRVALAPRRALVTARQILDGAGHAHARHLVHRDLKPDNVLLL